MEWGPPSAPGATRPRRRAAPARPRSAGAASRARMQCTHCSSWDVIEDGTRGELTCRACGRVLCDRMPDESDGYGIYLVPRSERVRSQFPGDAALGRISRASRRVNRAEIRVSAFAAQIRDLGDLVGVDQRTVNRAVVYGAIALRKGVILKRTEAAAAALLYGANLTAASPIGMKDIALRVGVPQRIVANRFKELKRGRDPRIGGVFPREALVRAPRS